MQPFPPQAWSSRFTMLTQSLDALLTEFRASYAGMFLKSSAASATFSGFLNGTQAAFIRDTLVIADFAWVMPTAAPGSPPMEQFWATVKDYAESCALRRIEHEQLTNPNDQHRVRVETLGNITEMIQQMRHAMTGGQP